MLKEDIQTREGELFHLKKYEVYQNMFQLTLPSVCTIAAFKFRFVELAYDYGGRKY